MLSCPERDACHVWLPTCVLSGFKSEAVILRRRERRRGQGRGGIDAVARHHARHEEVARTMTIYRLGIVAAWFGLLAPLPASAPALAQSGYPNKPVRIVVDSAAGSANDVTLRILAERLGAMWGQQVVALNHPGAGGSISAKVASTAPPDGYTLYMAAASVFVALPGAPGVAPNLPIELPRDFVPIGFVTLQPMFIAMSPALGIGSLPELIALAKAKPGQISYAATGHGRLTHLTMELLQDRAGIKLQLVPYAGGPAQAMNDVIGGRVGLVLDGYSSLAGALQGNAIKGLAVASPERLPGFENLPTVAETLPGFIAGGWNVLVAPVGTPDEIVRKVGADMRKALDEPEVKAKYASLGAFVQPMSPSEVTAFSQSEQKIWRPIQEHVAQQLK
jgi:tripartite-type tricarboxylate transporter receptor subunit TctC